MDKVDGYIIECVRLGSALKVNAIDPDTRNEATMIFPKNTPRSVYSNLIIKKLIYIKNHKNIGYGGME